MNYVNNELREVLVNPFKELPKAERLGWLRRRKISTGKQGQKGQLFSFCKALADCKLTALGFGGYPFTLKIIHGEGIKEQLDWACETADWKDMLSGFKVSNLKSGKYLIVSSGLKKSSHNTRTVRKLLERPGTQWWFVIPCTKYRKRLRQLGCLYLVGNMQHSRHDSLKLKPYKTKFPPSMLTLTLINQ